MNFYHLYIKDKQDKNDNFLLSVYRFRWVMYAREKNSEVKTGHMWKGKVFLPCLISVLEGQLGSG
jgi:hypothetical protein